VSQLSSGVVASSDKLHFRAGMGVRCSVHKFSKGSVLLILEQAVDRLKSNLKALASITKYPTLDEVTLVGQVLSGSESGVMIDVGACHGATTLPFAVRGWAVHAFEPDSENREILEAKVKGLAGVTVQPKAVSDVPGMLTLYRSPESVGISSLTAFTDTHRAAETVEVVTLTDYMTAEGISHVDFLKIDVEGFEREVLGGFPWDYCLPKVVVLEFEDAKTVPRGYSWTDLAEALVGHGYRVLVSEWELIVRYGTAHKWVGFRRYPAQLSDPGGWGNLIAVRPELDDRMSRVAEKAERRFRLKQKLSAIVSRI